MAGRPSGWHDERTARMYDEWTRSYPMYRETSADLVTHLGLASDAHVLDLACGTGVTTEELLSVLGPDGRVVGVDGSEPMLRLARGRITDGRVRFACARTRDLAVRGAFDAGVCNSAIWQLGDLRDLFGTLRKVMRRSVSFACNWGAGFLDLGEDQSVRGGGLFEVLFEVAGERGVLDEPRERGRVARSPTPDDVIEIIEEAAFVVEEHWWFTEESPQTAESFVAWLRIPVFTDWWFGGRLSYEERMRFLDEALERWDGQFPDSGAPGRWFCVHARAA